MNKQRGAVWGWRMAFLAWLLIALLLPIAAVLAQSGGPLKQTTGYDLSWWTVDGGGCVSDSGTGYALLGTIGQPDAAVWEGDVYTLGGGFWGSAVAGPHAVYLPLILHSS